MNVDLLPVRFDDIPYYYCNAFDLEVWFRDDDGPVDVSFMSFTARALTQYRTDVPQPTLETDGLSEGRLGIHFSADQALNMPVFCTLQIACTGALPPIDDETWDDLGDETWLTFPDVIWGGIQIVLSGPWTGVDTSLQWDQLGSLQWNTVNLAIGTFLTGRLIRDRDGASVAARMASMTTQQSVA